MEYETAGDPITGLKWTRKTTEKISDLLKDVDIPICPNTVAKQLKAMDYSLRLNEKGIAGSKSQDRNTQFEYIAELRASFAEEGIPIISVDTKKRELVGNFKNNGATWGKESRKVNKDDFRSLANGVAIPYGIYELLSNRGSVFIGMSHDSAEFSATSITKWWRYTGFWNYPGKKKLYILADGGGSNRAVSNAWKYFLQTKLCNPYGIVVVVSHYPPGTSKWNLIEHRLFCEISKNWAGHPLESYETVCNFILTTKTKTGLSVKAYLDYHMYLTGLKFTDKQLEQIRITRHDVCSKWNYTLTPDENWN
jgi:hypothetical protein